MDIVKVLDALRSTLVGLVDQREQAENYLKQVHKIIGFVPQLLQLVMSDDVEMPVRQAGAVYLKNMVSQYWEEEELEKPTDTSSFTIHENDKQLIRDNIVQAVIASQNPLRVQLSVCVSHMIKSDYPGRWPGIAEKAMTYLTSDEHNTWLGALICLYQLVKHFEYKKPEERQSLNEVMIHLLPVIQNMCIRLLTDQSELSVLLQKQILKVFFALVQVWLPVDIVTKEIFTSWMELVRQITERPVPPECNAVDEDERPELIWWKCKKWALHILTRCFERYGSPGNVIKEYNKFSEWFLKTFSAGILQVLLKLLDQYRNKEYISPRCLQLTLNYFTQAVGHALSWKIIKPHMQAIIQDVIFPLMCHSDEDEELWQNDPVEYIRVKYDIYEEFFNPSTAAQTLLHDAVAKRKDVLQKTMAFLMSILISPTTDARQKSGALQMIGSLAEILLNKNVYKDEIELMLMRYVVPELSSEHGYMRARACWVVRSFGEVKFKNAGNLQMLLDMICNIISNDKDLPVRIESAIALQNLISEQEKAKEILQPRIQQIILDLLSLIRETENDDLTSVLQKFVCVYSSEITPLAVEITTHLAQTFAKVVESVDGETSDDKSITAMGILNTLETICTVMEEQKEILQRIEGIVINVIIYILQHDVVEFFEEMLTLVYSLTTPQVSANMWNILPLLCELFLRDNTEYFTDMMPALHNYVTVDPNAFLSDPKRMEIMFSMCKTVLNSDAGEDAESHAAKLLEVILLEFKGLIDHVVPSFVEVALQRLTRSPKTTELRTMCLQVVIASIYYNPSMLLEILDKMRLPESTESITGQFLKQWLTDSDCFLGLHDRKVFVLGLCAILNLPNESRPTAINEIVKDILPALILVFKGLKRAYESRLKGNESDEENGEDGDGGGTEEVDDDDDVIDNDEDDYMRKLETSAKKNDDTTNDDDDDDDDDYDEDDDLEETALEGYETTLDKDECQIEEYQIFRTVLESLQHTDVNLCQMLTAHLTEDQKKDLDEIFRLAEQKRAAAESKKIEEAGGYTFTNTQVPMSFCFGSPQLPQ